MWLASDRGHGNFQPFYAPPPAALSLAGRRKKRFFDGHKAKSKIVPALLCPAGRPLAIINIEGMRIC